MSGGSGPPAYASTLGSAHDVYQRLVLKPSGQKPTLNLIQPGYVDKSYLYLKLTGDGSISGSRMPINPLNGNAALPDIDLTALETWITYGASEN